MFISTFRFLPLKNSQNISFDMLYSCKATNDLLYVMKFQEKLAKTLQDIANCILLKSGVAPLVVNLRYTIENHSITNDFISTIK